MELRYLRAKASSFHFNDDMDISALAVSLRAKYANTGVRCPGGLDLIQIIMTGLLFVCGRRLPMTRRSHRYATRMYLNALVTASTCRLKKRWSGAVIYHHFPLIFISFPASPFALLLLLNTPNDARNHLHR